MSAAPFIIKQGEPLVIAFQLTQDDGTPIDISGASLFSEVRDMLGGLVATPQLILGNPILGVFTYRVLSDSTWPIGRLVTDVAVSFGGIPFHTDTAFIQVNAPVTQLWDRQ